MIKHSLISAITVLWLGSLVFGAIAGAQTCTRSNGKGGDVACVEDESCGMISTCVEKDCIDPYNDCPAPGAQDLIQCNVFGCSYVGDC